jgi:hypothetical protein
MTIILPQPTVPTGMTVLEALTLGYLPAQVRVINAGSGLPNSTLHSLLSTGAVSHATLASSLQYEVLNPHGLVQFATYGGY